MYGDLLLIPMDVVGRVVVKCSLDYLFRLSSRLTVDSFLHQLAILYTEIGEGR